MTTNSLTSLLDFIRRRVGVGELVHRRVDRNSKNLYGTLSMSSKSCARLKIISSYCWSSCSVKPIIAQTPSFGQRNVYCVIPQYILGPPPSIFFWHFPSSITIVLFTICSILPMFCSSNICLSLYLSSSESHKTLEQKFINEHFSSS